MRVIVVLLLLLGLVTGCSSPTPEEMPALPVSSAPTPANSVPAVPPASAPVTSTPAEPTFPKMEEWEFTSISYKKTSGPTSGVAGRWKNFDSTGLPILIADDYNVTAFEQNGVRCKIELYGRQVLPGLALMMAATASMNNRFRQVERRKTTFEFTQAGKVLGTYDCSRI